MPLSLDARLLFTARIVRLFVTHDWVPFVAAGALKIVYDLALLWSCRNVKLD